MPSIRLDGETQSLQFSGRLIGGCLDSISRLTGSPYGDVPSFARAHRNDGLIVFIENTELKPFEVVRALMGLRLAGWFDSANGILVGRNAAAANEAPGDFSSREALAHAFQGLSCPVLVDVDVGHVGPQWSMIQGAFGVVAWEDGGVTLHQRLV